MSEMKVFVVQSEAGEYEQRYTWISGVYIERESAEKAIAASASKRLAHDLWRAAVRANWPIIPFGYFKFPLSPEQSVEHAAITAHAEGKAGPKPQYEPAESSELFEIEIGVWQSQPTPALSPAAGRET